MIRINLAPPPEQRWRLPRMPVWRLRLGVAFGLAAVVLAVVGTGYWRYLVLEEQQLADEIETGTNTVNVLTQVVGRAAKMKEQLADLQARLRAIQVLTNHQGQPLVLIDAFADTVPADLWITGLEERDSALRVTGTAFSSTAVANLMAALRASGRFKEVDIVVSRRDIDKPPHLVTFEVICRFES